MENCCFILRPPPKYTRHFPPKEKLMEIESQRKTCKTKKKRTIETCYTLGVCPGKTNIFPLNHIFHFPKKIEMSTISKKENVSNICKI